MQRADVLQIIKVVTEVIKVAMLIKTITTTVCIAAATTMLKIIIIVITLMIIMVNSGT